MSTQKFRHSRSIAGAITAAVALSPALVLAATAQSASAADPQPPSLRMFTPQTSTMIVYHGKNEPGWAQFPAYIAPVGGTFDLRVKRASYADPIIVTQVVHASDGSTTEVERGEISTGPRWRGLKKFFKVTLTGPDGSELLSDSLSFCPNSYSQQRIDPDGTAESTFPEGCYGMPFTLGAVWGIDDGWATPAYEYGFALEGPNGLYTATIKIRKAYRDLFDIPAEQAEATATYRLKKGTGEEEAHKLFDGRQPTSDRGRLPNVKLMKAPPTDQSPDLQSLPAFGMDIDHRRGKDWLAFGADVWVGGTSRLDIEGFRRPGEDLMDAYQYFFDGDEVVGKAEVGTLEFDRRRGHNHWHLEQFARYRLLNADQTHVVNSRKQSFCLAPTDPVDLSLDDAERRPWQVGLGSACGAEEALWIRETLPLGWGDTYYQSKGGQSFNITDLPNGVYYVSVEANPTGDLFETDTTNNDSLRMIVLEGKPGKRKICVPAVHGIDAEGTCS